MHIVKLPLNISTILNQQTKTVRKKNPILINDFMLLLSVSSVNKYIINI